MTLDAELHLVDSIDEVYALKQWMSESRPYIAVDTETEGLDWWRDRPRLLQVGDAHTAWAIPWHLWGGAILEILRDFRGDLIMHNLPFDLMMFEHWSGVKLPRHRMHDTRILAHIWEPHKPTALKSVSERHVDPRAAQSQRVLKEAMTLHGWTWATVPLDFQPYWVYACMDCILTSRCFDLLHPLVMADSPLAYDLELATCFVLVDMMFRGVAVDEEYAGTKLKDFRRYVDEASGWCQREYGVKAGSDIKVIERLQRDIPTSVYEFTTTTQKTGRLSLNKDVLKEVLLATNHPLAQVVFERRKIQRLASTYLDKFCTLAVNGRIYPKFNPVRHSDSDTEDDTSGYGAKTGRMSVSDPPLQQLPRKDNDYPAANVIRNCITATPGNMLIMCDWDQVEMRVYAHLCQDPGLIAAFDEGDFFVNIAREIFADPNFQKSDPRRQMTKNAGYAKIYGARERKFALTAGIDVDTATAFMARMDSLYPGMPAFNARIQQVAEQREQTEGLAYVRSIMTRRRYINDDGRLYALVNFLVQGISAEILKMKNVELQTVGLSEYLVLDVHDEMILDAPYEVAPEAGHALKGVMEDNNLLAVKLTASLSTAERWGGE
jgi:DNA polymerase-1